MHPRTSLVTCALLAVLASVLASPTVAATAASPAGSATGSAARLTALLPTAATGKPISAAASSRSRPAPVVGTSRPAAAAARIADFWTRERLAATAPLPVPHLTASGVLMAGSPTPARAARAQAEGDPWTAGGAVVRTTGRLYFTVRGAAAWCSASVVAGARLDLLVTAGHCLRSPGAWHRNVTFLPAYDRGARPYGRWAASHLWVTRQWFADSSPRSARDFRYDVGFVALRRGADGRRIGQVTGVQGIEFDTVGTPRVYAFGYPAERPFNGERLRSCSGDSGNDPYGVFNRRIRCSMNGGASGGPWLTGFRKDVGTGFQISVNSYTYGNRARLRHMQGPRFGAAIQSVYLHLQPVLPDRTFVRDMTTRRVYRVAGGAPLLVTTWKAFGGRQRTRAVPHAYVTDKLRDVPRDGFLRGTSTGRVYRVYRGHPYHIRSWKPWGGPQPYVDVDQVAIDRCDHLRCGPFGGALRAVLEDGRVRLSGWAMDPDRPVPITVRIHVDGKRRTAVLADDRRRGVDSVLHRGQNYGYAAALKVAPGRHRVCVTGVDIGRGEDTRLGCVPVNR